MGFRIISPLGTPWWYPALIKSNTKFNYICLQLIPGFCLPPLPEELRRRRRRSRLWGIFERVKDKLYVPLGCLRFAKSAGYLLLDGLPWELHCITSARFGELFGSSPDLLAMRIITSCNSIKQQAVCSLLVGRVFCTSSNVKRAHQQHLFALRSLLWFHNWCCSRLFFRWTPVSLGPFWPGVRNLIKSWSIFQPTVRLSRGVGGVPHESDFVQRNRWMSITLCDCTHHTWRVRTRLSKYRYYEKK